MGHVIDLDIPGLRARDHALADSLGRLWHRLRSERRALGIGAFTALLVTALGRLHIGWLRCANVGRVGRRICGMTPRWLEALLAASTAILGTISLVAFAHVLIDAMGEMTTAVQGFIREAHGVPARSAADQGFEARGGSVSFRTPQ